MRLRLQNDRFGVSGVTTDGSQWAMLLWEAVRVIPPPVGPRALNVAGLLPRPDTLPPIA